MRIVFWAVLLLAFFSTPMPGTWGGRSVNLFGTMICSLFLGVEIRAAVDRRRRGDRTT